MVKDVKLFTRYRDDGMDEMVVEDLGPEESTMDGPAMLLWCRTEDIDSGGDESVEEAGILLGVSDVEALIGVLQTFVRNAKGEVDGGN